MKNSLIFSLLIILFGCEEKDCYETNKVDYYKTETTEFYTITKPVYITECK